MAGKKRKALVALPFAAGVVVAIVAARAIRVGKRPFVDLVLERTQGTDVPVSTITQLRRGFEGAATGALDFLRSQLPSSETPGGDGLDPTKPTNTTVDAGVLPITA